MLRLLFIIFTTIFIFASCAKQKPKGILSEQKITELLTETSLIDAYLNTLPIDSGRKVMLTLYDNLFKQYDIDSVQFKQNLDFYYGNPKLTESIYKNVELKLKDYESHFLIEDSIRNVFVRDSINRVSRIQQLEYERRNMISNYYRDSSDYGFKEASINFYNRSNLLLQAYGIQTAAIESVNQPMNSFEDPILQDSVLRKQLSTPLYKLLLNKPNDSTKVDFRFQQIFFLKNADLNLKTGYTYQPVFNTVSPNEMIKVDSVSSGAILDSLKSIESVNTQGDDSPSNGNIQPEKRIPNPKPLLKSTVQ